MMANRRNSRGRAQLSAVASTKSDPVVSSKPWASRWRDGGLLTVLMITTVLGAVAGSSAHRVPFWVTAALVLPFSVMVQVSWNALDRRFPNAEGHMVENLVSMAFIVIAFATGLAYSGLPAH